MLPKKNRNDKKTIEKIFKEGKFVNSANLSFKFIYEPGGLKKISFLTPKTVAKKAFVRNRLRRRGYVILKDIFEKVPNSLSGVFIFGKRSAEFFACRKNKENNPLASLEKEIKYILNKL